MGSRCIVVGGGAAGMMAACSAADGFDEVILLEKNEKLGKKIYITGKGRCNVTNDCDADVFFGNVVRNSKFLYSAYYGFDNNMLTELIERSGCKLKTERGGRVFPVSDKASDIIRTFERLLANKKVDVRLNTAVKDIVTDRSSDGDTIATGVRLKNRTEIKGDRIILATGGLSYPSTGSDGDGHRWLKGLGHEITECRPSLVPLRTKEGWVKSLQGLSLKNVGVRLNDLSDEDDTGSDADEATGKKRKNKKGGLIYEGFGEMLFTHFGVSGPLILSASSFYAGGAYTGGAVLHIDLKPALDTEKLDARILRDFEGAKNKDIKNILGGLMPNSMIDVMLDISRIDGTKKVHDITKEERNRLTKAIKDIRLHITGTGDYNEAIITRGGVNVGEINPSTMESKLVKNLYVAGELLDTDALTGGFNLQIAWSTGHLAGMI